ncbi:hypothetical protein GCM10023310_27580 [Paenibacillus vulneris]|uniref:Uncharacterized protein n=1 Tax=Paenibacillus vulneris TaxID=1133364 RepID=A0ABW3UQ45_9BACL|nr:MULTISPECIES: hypothetical protein [unclassified Paenibacillus]MBE1442180.1 hypothetical protein [Paenibacillus sp. OAS669]
MRSEDQIKRMVIQLEQMLQRLDTDKNRDEIKEVHAQLQMLQWVLDAPAGKYHA